jgi:hypothetical protein
MVISRCVIHQPRVYLAYGSEDVSLSSLGSLASLAPHSQSLRAGTDNAASSVTAFAFVKLPYGVFTSDLPADPRALRTKSKDLHKPNTNLISTAKSVVFAFSRGRAGRERAAPSRPVQW